MAECHVLLGVHPAAAGDEIEEAYRNKKREYDPGRFEEGTPERENAVAMQKKLDQAYNDAIMATFAPIRAFSAPPASSAPAAPARPAASGPVPPSPPRPAAPRPFGAHDGGGSFTAAPVRSSWTPPPKAGPELEGLVEEVPVAFSDEDLLKMDISQLREAYMPSSGSSSSYFTLGIEDPLLRSYVWMFISFTLFDFLMRILMGNAWGGVSGLVNNFSGVMNAMGGSMPAGMAATAPPPPPPSAIWSLITSIVSMLYLFACSLVVPVAVRFFVVGEPMGSDKRMIRILMDIASIAAARLIMVPAGLLFLLLPAEWAGSSWNLIFVTPLLCEVTLKYGG
ncbi:MAG: J domain-containing protein [Synergistaceae bacterium]|jgi:hypothetical protein|nr:J domain-containing protein [Synergistaceae bacterium]